LKWPAELSRVAVVMRSAGSKEESLVTINHKRCDRGV